MTFEPEDTAASIHERYEATLREIISRRKWPSSWIARVLLQRHQVGRSKAADVLWARIERARKSLSLWPAGAVSVSEFNMRAALALRNAGITAEDAERCMRTLHSAGFVVTDLTTSGFSIIPPDAVTKKDVSEREELTLDEIVDEIRRPDDHDS